MESPQIVLAISVGMSALDAVDGSSTGTEVPWMWVLLRPPRFGGAKHASGHDNRSRYRQVCFSNMQPRVKEKAPRRRGPNSQPKRREGCVPTTRVYSRFVPDICIILGAVPATARRGAKALPSWDSKTRWNNLLGDLAVNVTAGSSGRTNSPHRPAAHALRAATRSHHRREA
jgi:hypothetical protein